MARLPDPFTNPEIALGFTSASLIDNEPLIRDELPNGKVLESKVSAQYWGIDISYPDMFPEEFKFLDAFVAEYKRTGGYIEVLLPQYENFRVRGNTATTSIPPGQKGSALTISGVNTLQGVPKPGDLFKLSSHPKVYKITVVVNNGSNWVLGLYPDLFTTTNGSEKPVFNGILFRTKLASGETLNNNQSIDGVYTGVGLKLRESL